MIHKLVFIFTVFSFSLCFSQEKSIDQLAAYPNPFSNTTNISFEATNNQTVLITIKNIIGKTIYSKQIAAVKGKNNLPFNRNDLRSGMYIYAIQNNTDFISKRFVIK